MPVSSLSAATLPLRARAALIREGAAFCFNKDDVDRDFANLMSQTVANYRSLFSPRQTPIEQIQT